MICWQREDTLGRIIQWFIRVMKEFMHQIAQARRNENGDDREPAEIKWISRSVAAREVIPKRLKGAL